MQTEAENPAKFVVTGAASAYLFGAMKIKSLPVGFVVPAQPVKASKPPVGTDWVHEIKHDGYRLIVRRDGPTLRLYSHDWTARLSAIATAVQRIKAKSFTIDSEAVVLGPTVCQYLTYCADDANNAMIYAFDLIELTARIFAISRSWTGKPRWRGCCEIPRLASYSTNTSPRTALSHSGTQEALFPRKSAARIDPVLVRSGSRSAIPPATPCSGSAARFGSDEPEAARAR